MGIITTYLASVDIERRTEIDRIYRLVRQIEPDAIEGTSYGMPCLLYRSKGIVAVMHTKDFLSYYPFSGGVITAATSVLNNLEHTTGAIHLSRTEQLSRDQIAQLIILRREEIDVQTK